MLALLKAMTSSMDFVSQTLQKVTLCWPKLHATPLIFPQILMKNVELFSMLIGVTPFSQADVHLTSSINWKNLVAFLQTTT